MLITAIHAMSSSEMVISICRTGSCPGEDTCYGPGLELHLPPGQDPVRQMLMTISDDDIAWIAVINMARKFGWKILDPQSGREFQA